jgi:hypothetical protein
MNVLAQLYNFESLRIVKPKIAGHEARIRDTRNATELARKF